MEFGYFTLSDNHYLDNSRSANQFVEDILDETLYADELGFHSAWIGEHHFSSLGVLSCPDLTLAYAAARTKKIRLAPAVTVLPLHHRSASPSNGRASICSRAAASIGRPAVATIRANTRPSTSPSPRIRRSSTKAWRW